MYVRGLRLLSVPGSQRFEQVLPGSSGGRHIHCLLGRMNVVQLGAKTHAVKVRALIFKYTTFHPCVYRFNERSLSAHFLPGVRKVRTYDGIPVICPAGISAVNLRRCPESFRNDLKLPYQRFSCGGARAPDGETQAELSGRRSWNGHRPVSPQEALRCAS